MTGAAPAGHDATAGTREAAAARGVDTGEAADGEGTHFAQGEGQSCHQPLTSVVVAGLGSATCLILPMCLCFVPADSCVSAGGGA